MCQCLTHWIPTKRTSLMHSHGMYQACQLLVMQNFKVQPRWKVMTSRWSVSAVSHRGCTRTASQAQRLILPSPCPPFVRPSKNLVTGTSLGRTMPQKQWSMSRVLVQGSQCLPWVLTMAQWQHPAARGLRVRIPRHVDTLHQRKHDSAGVPDVSRQATPSRALAPGSNATNRFVSLATESDDEQTPRTRQPETKIAFEVVQKPPIRHSQLHKATPHVSREVHRAAQVVRNLADRVGHVNDSEDVPRALRRQQWSAVNVPLMWSGSVGSDTCPVLQWLAGAAQHIESMIVGSTTLNGHGAVVVGWEALSEVMRSWDIRSREDLVECIFRQEFPRPRWCAHITARAQERILTMAVAVDARVSGVEAIYVQVALLDCRRVPMPVEPIFHEVVRGTVGRPRTAFPETFLEECWAVVDDVNLRDFFDLRFPVLQSCPHHVRGRFRQANRPVLEARHEAARSQFWRRGLGKHFASSPCCFRRPQGECRVSTGGVICLPKAVVDEDEAAAPADFQSCLSGFAPIRTHLLQWIAMLS